MKTLPLSQTVETFALKMAKHPDSALELPWAWQSYNEEGIRFSYFRTYQQLYELAARLRIQRAALQPLTETQIILGQYHAAYRDLQAVLLGLSEAQMDLPPAENEWPVRQALIHILTADIGFYGLVRFALDRLRSGETEPAPVPDDAWFALIGLDEAEYKAIMVSPVGPVLARLQTQHDKVIDSFGAISAAELDAPSYYWESETYSLRFRLHRFHAHMRQHTIQIEKTRAALGLPPTETCRLLRHIYAALADVEGTLIQYDLEDPSLLHETTQSIQALTLQLEDQIARS